MYCTAGERALDHYLRETGLPFEYQPPHLHTEKRPDFLVRTRVSPAILEITEFGEGEVDKAHHARVQASRQEIPGGGWFSTYASSLSIKEMCLRIRSRIEAELPQLTPFQGKYPGVVVLYNPGDRLVILDHVAMQGALFGFLIKDLRTALSAVAVLEIVPPRSRTVCGRGRRLLPDNSGTDQRAAREAVPALIARQGTGRRSGLALP